jgi:very-short-patch-repair endonuclease
VSVGGAILTGMRMPSDDAGEWEWTLFSQQGIVTYTQALRHKGRGHVRNEIDRGRWRRVANGVIATTPRLSQSQHFWVAVLTCGRGAVLAGLAAARVSGLRVASRRLTIDVLVPAQRNARPRPALLTTEMPGIRLHRSQNPCQLVLPDPPRTAMPRSVVDAAQWALTDREAQLIVVSACQQRLVTPQELLDAVEDQPRARRRGIVREAAMDALGGATALSEIDFVKLCRRHRLPEPDLQERRKDAGGRTRYLDAYWRKWKLHVEIDGAHHMDARHWGKDMLRQNEVWLEGDRVLRFPAFLVRTEPLAVVAQLRAALGASRVR